jgi:hypothetical protein
MAETNTDEIISQAFRALIAKEGCGETWSDRAAADSHAGAGRFLAHAAAEATLNAALDAISKLKPGATSHGVNADYRFESASEDRDRLTVRITDRSGRGEWTLGRATGRHGPRFTIRQVEADGATAVLASGDWRKGPASLKAADQRHHVANCNHGRGTVHAMLRLADILRPDIEVPPAMAMARSHPAWPVLEADGGIPGVNCRKLYRRLHEETCRRTLGWATELFDETARLLADEGAWWGSETLAWTYGFEDRFPKLDTPTTYACLIPREGRNTPAIVFRDARPCIETETCMVWREIGADGRPGMINLLPLDDVAGDDIEEFRLAGGVPAISYDPSTGAVRVTERAMSSNALETFATHVGEAWSVIRDRQLYARPDDRRMFTSDFTVFDRIETWTRRGRFLAETNDATPTTTKGPRR